MEQSEIMTAYLEERLQITRSAAEKLSTFAGLIESENRKYNLTGHRTIEKIIDDLIVGSLEPFFLLDVPRGTSFADLGTGAGIPGIPIAAVLEESSGVLFDSSSKKIAFINKACMDTGILNAEGICCRIEDAGLSPEYRERFDWVFSRAMSDLYTAAELASPLIKTGGSLYLYSREQHLAETPEIKPHLTALGLELQKSPAGRRCRNTGLCHIEEGILFKKISPCGDQFPRRTAAIKRGKNLIFKDNC